MLKLKILICIFAFLLLNCGPGHSRKVNIGSVFKELGNVGEGLFNEVLNTGLPSPREILSSGKQLIAGYPWVVVLTALDQVCSTVFATNAAQPEFPADIHKMDFQFHTQNCENHTYPLLEARKMLQDPDFDVNKKVVIMVTGFLRNVNDSETIETMSKAYRCRGDSNFIVLDSAGYIETLYTWSSFNTELIGESLAKGVQELTESVPLENIHLIGHSLGAQIVGSAGRTFTKLTGKTLPRITGLDPAKPCFSEGEPLNGIGRGDADFIDIIHSNPGVLGERYPSGDVDFYVGGTVPLRPGCLDIVCSHERSWKYYTETVYPGAENDFLGVRCNSLTKVKDGKCKGPRYPMGYAVPHNLKGDYFLDVNPEYPYGQNADIFQTQINKNCGLCSSK